MEGAMLKEDSQSDAILIMKEELNEAFLAAAIDCFQRLSECPDIKDYRVYREPENSSSKQFKERNTRVRERQTSVNPVRYSSSKPSRWVLVVSAKNSICSSTVKVRKCQ
ncbi:MAG TPA: hypothetical protein V6D50_00430 [Chroococcales cyanobacterium]|jgi:hypothetical protein